jgi:hypothetical protein
MLAPQLMPKNLPFHAFVLANNYYFVGKHDDEVHNTSDDGGNCYVSQDGRIPIRNTIFRLFLSLGPIQRRIPVPGMASQT